MTGTPGGRHFWEVPSARISLQTYEALVGAYREDPGNAQRAARIAGVHWRTAKRAWEEGWPSPPWAMPIERVLENEEIEVRARARALEEERRALKSAAERELELERAQADARARESLRSARLDVAEEKARALQAARSSLSAAMTSLAVLGTMSRGIVGLAQRLARDLEAEVPAGTVSRESALDTLTRYANLTSAGSLAAKRAMEISRLVTGNAAEMDKLSPPSPDVPVRMDRAVELLGTPEEVEAAAAELFAGQLTERALLLVESQGVAPGERS